MIFSWRCIQNVQYFRRSKHILDHSRIPKVLESDIKERFVRGSGPGGSFTSKNSNCVVLKHFPTGIVVKCHVSRLLQDNQKLARKMLIRKLDNLLNGDKSLDGQKKMFEEKKSSVNFYKQNRLRMLKEKWKQENEKN